MLEVVVCEMLFFALLLFVLVYYFGEGIYDLKQGRAEFEIPGLKEGFVPQGLAYDASCDRFLLSGYFKKGASRVYVIDGVSGRAVKFVEVENLKGQVLRGHFGGVVCHGNMVFIASDGEIFGFSTLSLDETVNAGVVKATIQFKTGNGADFCFVQGGMLFSGEYYKFRKFETDISHHMILENEEQFHSVCFGFKLIKLQQKGMLELEPDAGLAVPDMVQGLMVSGERIFTSCSYGLSKSTLGVYENVFNFKPNHYFVAGEKKIPLYSLGDKKNLKKLYLPAMSEGICEKEGRLFVLFENYAKKYRAFTRTKVKNIFSFKMNKF